MLLFITIILTDLLSAAEMDLLIPALPEIQHFFGISASSVQLLLSMNFITYAISALYAGALGDAFGKRRVILISLIILIFGSVLTVCAPSFPLLLLGRILQGLGMAGPGILSFVIVADEYPKEKQSSIIGSLNGVITLALAVSPVIGCYLTLYAGWRSNFIALLLFGCITLIFCYFFVPSRKPTRHKNNFSLKGYKELLKSRSFCQLLLIITFLDTTYWTFLGMASLLYIDHMGVPLEHFGWFQGVLAGSYAIVSFLCPKLFKHFKEDRLLTLSIYGMLLVTTVMFLVGIALKDNPFVISILIGLFSMFLVFPITILYPRALNLHDKLKGRASALINISVLFSTAFGIQIISCFYNGQFLLLGFFIFVLTIIAFMTYKKYSEVHTSQNEP